MFLPCAEEIGLHEANPFDYNNDWTRGQMSGTCSAQAYRSYFKSFAQQEGINYHNLSYEMKRYSINEYSIINTNRLSDGVVQRQMTFATQNLARHIHKLYEKDLLSGNRLKEGLNLIERVEKALVAGLAVPTVQKEVVDQPQYVTDSRLSKTTPTTAMPSPVSLTATPTGFEVIESTTSYTGIGKCSCTVAVASCF